VSKRSKVYTLLAPARQVGQALTESGKTRLAHSMREKAGTKIEERLLRIIETSGNEDMVIKASKLYLSYAYGMPTETKVQANVSSTDPDVPAARTLSTRELEEVAEAETVDEAEPDPSE